MCVGWAEAVLGYEKRWVTFCGFFEPRRWANGTAIVVGTVIELPT